MHMDIGDVVFEHRNKICVADFSKWISRFYQESDYQLTLMTTKEREHLYSKREVRNALEAKEFIKNAGYPSLKEALHMARDGNLVGIPHSAEDINRLYDIYGPPVESIHGKMVNKK